MIRKKEGDKRLGEEERMRNEEEYRANVTKHQTEYSHS